MHKMKKIKWQHYVVINTISNLGSKRKRIAGLEDEISGARSSSTKFEQKVRQLELDINTWKSKFPALERQVTQREARIAELEELLAEQKAVLKIAQHDKSSQASKLRQYEKDLANCRQRVRPLQHQLGEQEHRLSGLQIQVDKRDKIIIELREELRNYERLRTTSISPPIPSKIIRSQEERQSTPPKLFTSTPVQVDDLKRIQGVGPKLERMLNDLGIYQFKQISEFNAQDEQWVDDHLTAFKGRISRDNWVAQSRKLKDEK